MVGRLIGWLRRSAASMRVPVTEIGAEMTGGRAIVDQASFEEVLALPMAVIYKFSPLCNISYYTNREVETYLSSGGRAPVYVLDVIAHRTLSRAIADRLGVRHQSPQVILLENGTATWHGSHGDVTTDALRAATGDF